MSIDMASEPRMREFMRLFTSHELRLRAFALAVVPNWADAEDVLQQANLVIWRKFDQFEPGTDFFAWSRRIIKLVAMDYRKRQARAKVHFGDEFYDAIENEAGELADELDERQQVLGECIGRLRADHREVLQLRYEQGANVEAIAERVGRSTDAVYIILSRVRKALMDCVGRKLNLGGAT